MNEKWLIKVESRYGVAPKGEQWDDKACKVRKHAETNKRSGNRSEIS